MSIFYEISANCQVPELGDKWELIFGKRTEGFFVEVGAYDGENFSNTSCLADAGWAGLYIEPIEEFAEKCRSRHAGNPRIIVLNCAVSDTAGMAQIFVGDTLTTLISEQVADYENIDWAKGLHCGESREIKTALLDTILEEHGAPIGFDLLVVDVEGAEEKVINGFDIAKWSPKVILIELEDEHPDFCDNPRITNSVTAIRNKLSEAGYSIFFKDHINSLYLRKDVADRVTKKTYTKSIQPPVSIGLPTYNRPEMLTQAVTSIREQAFSDFELIISDNCSPNPKVSEICTKWAEDDHRITYLRQIANIGALGNFLTVLNKTSGTYFMWASDDDLWDRQFLKKAVMALVEDESIEAWMCHISVIDINGTIVREIPNLARFGSSRLKSLDLAKFIAHPECLGKANLFYSVFRRDMLSTLIEKVLPYFDIWGSDMIFLYAFLCRANIKIDQEVYFKKRLTANEVGFIPINPRKNIVPWDCAGKYYGAFIELSRGTPYLLFTHIAVRLRYLYDVFYWRLKLKQHAPWLPRNLLSDVLLNDKG